MTERVIQSPADYARGYTAGRRRADLESEQDKAEIASLRGLLRAITNRGPLTADQIIEAALSQARADAAAAASPTAILAARDEQT